MIDFNLTNSRTVKYSFAVRIARKKAPKNVNHSPEISYCVISIF